MNICPDCGAMLEDGESCDCSKKSVEMKTCPWCKSEIPADASRCRYCAKDESVAKDLGNTLTLGCTLPILIVGALIVMLGYCGAARH